MGEDWQEVPSRNHRQSNADDVSKVAKSVFVTNFPESVSALNLWKSCSVYEIVVDVFIPSKKSKAGKRFAFVRFIKVFNLDRLVENLCTIWIGRYHLYANLVRFEQSHKSFSAPTANAAEVPKKSFVPRYSNAWPGSYANVVNGVSPGSYGSLLSTSLAMVLEDTCLVVRDLSKHVMSKVKDFTAITRLYTILKYEGFLDVKLNYLRGTWVLFEFCNNDTKVNFMNHNGINSWFQVIQDASPDFVSDDRIGETLDLEDNVDTSFGCKRLCVKTAHPVLISETFKIIVIGRVFMVRAKELFTWNPSFIDNKEKDYASEEESDFVPNNNDPNNHINEEVFGDVYGTDDDGVPETVFGPNTSSSNQVDRGKENSKSEDPFGIYNMLANKKENVTSESRLSLSRPPGFTPEVTP
nr:RNA-directed DNA polymerase, eukaryota, nucleotide-binding alpha-beta plait domain protein [Tanacetum cinerariifolium]